MSQRTLASVLASVLFIGCADDKKAENVVFKPKTTTPSVMTVPKPEYIAAPIAVKPEPVVKKEEPKLTAEQQLWNRRGMISKDDLESMTYSEIHNKLGEPEYSHQSKVKENAFMECWKTSEYNYTVIIFLKRLDNGVNTLFFCKTGVPRHKVKDIEAVVDTKF